MMLPLLLLSLFVAQTWANSLYCEHLPILPEQFGDLSLIHGMLLWQSRASAKLYHSPTAQGRLPRQLFSAPPGSRGLGDVVPVGRERMAVVHMDGQLIVRIALEISKLQKESNITLEAFQKDLRSLCEESVHFQRSIKDASHRHDELKARVGELTAAVQAMEKPSTNDQELFNILQTLRHTHCLDTPFYALEKILLKSNGSAPLNVFQAGAVLGALYELAGVGDGRKYAAVREWWVERFGWEERMGKDRFSGRKNGKEIEGMMGRMDGLVGLLANTRSQFPHSALMENVIGKLKGRTPLTDLIPLSGILSPKDYLDLTRLNTQLSLHQDQLHHLRTLLTHKRSQLGKTAGSGKIMGSLDELAEAVHEAARMAGRMAVPGNLALAVWQSYYCSRHPGPQGLDEYYMLVRGELVGIPLIPRDCTALPTIIGDLPRAGMSTRDLEDRFLSSTPLQHATVMEAARNLVFGGGINFQSCMETTAGNSMAFLDDRSVGSSLFMSMECLQRRPHLIYMKLRPVGSEVEYFDSISFPTGTNTGSARAFFVGRDVTPPPGVGTTKKTIQLRGTEGSLHQFQAYTIGSDTCVLYDPELYEGYELLPHVGNLLAIWNEHLKLFRPEDTLVIDSASVFEKISEHYNVKIALHHQDHDMIITITKPHQTSATITLKPAHATMETQSLADTSSLFHHGQQELSRYHDMHQTVPPNLVEWLVYETEGEVTSDPLKQLKVLFAKAGTRMATMDILHSFGLFEEIASVDEIKDVSSILGNQAVKQSLIDHYQTAVEDNSVPIEPTLIRALYPSLNLKSKIHTIFSVKPPSEWMGEFKKTVLGRWQEVASDPSMMKLLKIRLIAPVPGSATSPLTALMSDPQISSHPFMAAFHQPAGQEATQLLFSTLIECCRQSCRFVSISAVDEFDDHATCIFYDFMGNVLTPPAAKVYARNWLVNACM